MYLLARMEVSEILLLAAVVAVTSTLLLRIRRYMRRQKKSKSVIVRTDRPESSERGHHIGLPAEAMDWEVQMHETARDLSAQLDSKMSALGHLVREADRAAARLEKALEGAVDQVETSGRVESCEATSHDSAEAADQSTRSEIYTLADYGFDAREIARRAAVPIGEVELILRLRKETKNS